MRGRNGCPNTRIGRSRHGATACPPHEGTDESMCPVLLSLLEVVNLALFLIDQIHELGSREFRHMTFAVVMSRWSFRHLCADGRVAGFESRQELDLSDRN